MACAETGESDTIEIVKTTALKVFCNFTEPPHRQNLAPRCAKIAHLVISREERLRQTENSLYVMSLFPFPHSRRILRK